MRLLVSFLATFLTFIGGQALADKEGEQQHRVGDSCDDGHGKLIWESIAKQSGNDWLYRRTIKNRDSKRRCLVTWKTGGIRWQSLLDPGEEKQPDETTTNVPPEKVMGEIYYNGGAMAGDAQKRADAYFPEGQAVKGPRKTSSKAQVAFALSGEVHKIHIEATSRETPGSEKRMADYSLRFSPILPSGVRVRWTSIESGSDDMKGDFRIDPKTHFLDLQRTDPEPKTLKARISVGGKNALALRNGTIQFFFESPENKIAEAWVPALAPSAEK
jgi:hypothetical protein